MNYRGQVRGSRMALQFGNDLLSQLLAQFDTPLVERVNVPDYALCKHVVLVEGDEFSKGLPELAVRRKLYSTGDCLQRRGVARANPVSPRP